MSERTIVRLDRIYTRRGDRGETSAGDGQRVSKSDLRIELSGEIDELIAAVGLVVAADVPEATRATLVRIQNELFDLGADLATPGEDFAPQEMALRIVPEQIDRLEREIDEMNEALAPLNSFILPGGGGGSAELHLARAVTRRAERSAVAASASVRLNPLALTYLNRLSDHLFVLGRLLARDEGGDVLWQPGATR